MVLVAPQKENTCAVVVTFQADSAFPERLDRVVGQVGTVVIVDNGSGEPCVRQLRTLTGRPGVHLILNHENEGIAHALNQGSRWAAARGYCWVLTLDQDTIVAPNMMESLAEIYRASPFQAELAVIGSNFTNRENSRPFYDSGGVRDMGEEVKTVITSGSLVSLQAFEIIGPYRDEFFIDFVDLEYCLRARDNGFHIIRSRQPLMEHSIGRLSEHRLPWKRTGTSNHLPWRQYFMMRNLLIMAREYACKEPGWVLATLWSRMKSILLMCLFEKDRIRKIGYSVLGGLDGLRGKTSRLA
jgi:rhamnosyltransferase